MNPITRYLTVPITALALALAVPLGAQTSPAPVPSSGAAPAQAPMSQDQLDSLLAPIALYPDQLLTQALMASTYPLDVVEAARFVKANQGLKGDALDKAVEEKTWDPSVQSLTAFPQVLEMMNDKLDWTQQLGDAFLSDQARVMQTVQRLRTKASEAGNLKSNEQQKVVVEQKTIIIEPAQPSTVYVPVYNPTVVYGPWWAHAYTPWYWPPPPYYYGGAAIVGGMIGFGVGLAIGANHWGWSNANWGGNNVNINVNRNNTFINNNAEFKNKVNNGNWQHDPGQRKGVAYRDAGTRDKFQKVDSNAVSSRRDYRGHEGGAGNMAGNRPGEGGAGNRAGAGGAGTMDKGGAGNRPGAGGAGSMGGAGNMSAGRPSDRAGSMGGGGAGGISASSPANRAGSGGYSGNRSAGGTSFGGGQSFNSGMNRQQSQSVSNRGASSRASMGGGGGGGARGGGGGGRRR